MNIQAIIKESYAIAQGWEEDGANSTIADAYVRDAEQMRGITDEFAKTQDVQKFYDDVYGLDTILRDMYYGILTTLEEEAGVQ